MKKTLLIYWPEGGNVERSARLIADQFDNIEVKPVNQADPGALANYDLILIGSSTVGAENWEEAEDNNVWAPFFLNMEQQAVDLKGNHLAFFGLGDQVLYPDHFVDGMGIIYSELEKFNPTFIGQWPADGYDFTGSMSLEGDNFLGLALDEDQQPELTEERVTKWVAQIKQEAGF